MARGWESKSVEDQQASAETRSATVGPELTPEERERKAKRGTLALSRARILQDLQVACDTRHRAMLEKALADVDAMLGALTGPPAARS
jgi:hypothetical protein